MQEQLTPRQRFRAQMRDEAKQVALRQLAEGGPQAISINAIGKALGVSGPALYRYFASRDALLTELIVDAYDDLGAALEGTTDLGALAAAYRAWALAQPHRYRLLYAPPLPGYDAHSDEIVAASQRAMRALLGVLGEDPDGPPTQRALGLWARMHGFASLEIGGNFASMGVDPDALFEAVVE